LGSGDFTAITQNLGDDIFAFIRHTDDATAIVILNRSTSSKQIEIDLAPYQLPISEVYIDFFSGNSYSAADGRIRLSLEAKTGAVLY